MPTDPYSTFSRCPHLRSHTPHLPFLPLLRDLAVYMKNTRTNACKLPEGTVYGRRTCRRLLTNTRASFSVFRGKQKIRWRIKDAWYVQITRNHPRCLCSHLTSCLLAQGSFLTSLCNMSMTLLRSDDLPVLSFQRWLHKHLDAQQMLGLAHGDIKTPMTTF